MAAAAPEKPRVCVCGLRITTPKEVHFSYRTQHQFFFFLKFDIQKLQVQGFDVYAKEFPDLVFKKIQISRAILNIP